jgi:hypothetical protein
VFGVRFLSLMAIVAALFLARVAVSTDLPPGSDRAELPSDPGAPGNDDGSLDDDGDDLALPSGTTLSSVAFPAQPLLVEPEHAPATSPFAASIFRPPTSALA